MGCKGQSDHAAPEALFELSLVDQDGTRLNPASFEGKVLLLNFMFTRCAGPCPLLTKLLVDARQRLSKDVREGVQFLSVSVDSEHDSPNILKAFARRHSADDPNWRFARMTATDLEKLAQRLTVFDPDVPPAPSAHSMALYLFDRRGRALQRYEGNVVNSERLAREITAVVSLGGRPSE